MPSTKDNVPGNCPSFVPESLAVTEKVQTTTGINTQSMKVWLQHIGGALAILEMRGKPQNHNEVGYRLFSQLRTYIVRHATSVY